jgi:hypothetical protein
VGFSAARRLAKADLTLRGFNVNDFKKLETPRGAARSMTSLSPTSMHVNFDGSGADWMGPRTPMIPVAPPETAGRAFDYQPGFNLVTQPRANEPITFQMLRAMSESLDVLRLVIETRKSQMCRQPWAVRIKHDSADGKRPSAAALSPSVRSTIRDITEFLREPSFGTNFRQWLRVILEDHFVIDAVALYCLRSPSGELLELQNTDGATIKKIIGPDGRMPRPIPFSGQPFIWNGLAITSENYHTQGFKGPVNGFLLPPCYQQFLHGVAANDLTQNDLLYSVMNLRSHSSYGYSPVEFLVNTVNMATRRVSSQIDYYREGNTPESLFAVPETWSPDVTMRFQDYFDSLMVGDLGARRRMKFIPAGGASSYIPIKEPALKAEIDEWLTRIVCYAFSVPPTPFMALANRSIAEEHSRSGEEEGLQTTKLFISDLINGVITDEFVPDGSIEFAWLEEEEINQVEQSKILARLVETGIITVNQARQKLGESPDTGPAANTLMVKTATGYVPLGTASKPTTGDEENDD